MIRTPEPELMVDEEQVFAYAHADFDEPHGRFLLNLGERLSIPSTGRAVDLGCGTGDITLRFAREYPSWTIDAVDGSLPMLAVAREALESESMTGRVKLHAITLPAERPVQAKYDLLLSNSLLHHLSDPAALWAVLRSWSATRGLTFIMDLMRPKSDHEARLLVDKYAAKEQQIHQRDFYRSLRAAYLPKEVRRQLQHQSLGHLQVDVVSDRHMIIWGPVNATC